MLEAHDIQMSEDQARKVLAEVKKRSIKNKRTITDDEFLEITAKFKS